MMRRRDWLAGTLLATVAGRMAWASGAANTEADRPLVWRYGKPVAPAPARVFAAGPPAAVLVAALAPDRLLGWPFRLPEGAHAMLPEPLAGLPVTGRLAGRGSTVTVEALLALRPDLVLDAGSVDGYYQSQAERMAAQTGIPYVLVDGRLPQSAQQLREVGALLGVPQRAETLAAYADATLAQAQQLRRRMRQHPPRVYLARGADGLETGWRGSINAELLEFVGADNVATTGAGAGTEGRGRVSYEQVLAWNPELIVTQEPGLAERLRAAPLWRSVRAVQAGRVWQVPNLPFGWIDGPPGINRLIGLRWLSMVLEGWSDAAGIEKAGQAQARIQAEAEAFNRLFYGTPAGIDWPQGALP